MAPQTPLSLLLKDTTSSLTFGAALKETLEALGIEAFGGLNLTRIKSALLFMHDSLISENGFVFYHDKVASITHLATICPQDSAYLAEVQSYLGVETLRVYYIDSAEFCAARKLLLVASIIKRFNASELYSHIMQAACDSEASDIHVERLALGVDGRGEVANLVRLREGGILREYAYLEEPAFSALKGKLKLEARLEVHKDTIAQDGRLSYEYKRSDEQDKDKEKLTKKIDVRVSSMPAFYGESVVARLIGIERLRTLASLGLDAQRLEDVYDVISRRSGLVIFSGATGSGKSSSMHAALLHLASLSKKIITIEDPIERVLPFITQVALHRGFGFDEVLKSILRQDPDVICLGEIRDKETLQSALRLALSGHMVFATLHCSSVDEVFMRLASLGADMEVARSVVTLAMAQKLVKTLCLCKKVDIIPQKVHKDFTKYNIMPSIVYKAYGCEDCSFSGYSNRVAIIETYISTASSHRSLFELSLRELSCGKIDIKQAYV